MATDSTIDDSQRQAAKVVGLAYLLAIPLALFGEAAAVAGNVAAHERLFRLGTASNLAVFALDIVLITALYVVLKPVNRHLALLAAFCGVIETAVLMVATVSDLEALRVLSGAEYLRAFDADRLQALAKMAIGAHGAAYHVGLALAGLRSSVFCYLWLKSRYIPKPLAALGVVASLLLGACAYAFIIFPELRQVVSIGVYGGRSSFSSCRWVSGCCSRACGLNDENDERGMTWKHGNSKRRRGRLRGSAACCT